MRTAKPFLIVARNLDVQDTHVERLRAIRVPAIGVSTSEEAIRLTALARFGAVLFDIEWREDWDGLERLRQQLSRDVPIVASGACPASDGAPRRRARALGCAGFVASPATTTAILRALQQAAASDSSRL